MDSCNQMPKLNSRGKVVQEPEWSLNFSRDYPDEESEPFTIWVHEDIKDFEWDSYGASAGFMLAETQVAILERLEVSFEAGPFSGKTLPLLKIKGPNHVGEEIIGWALERDIDLN